MKPHLILAAILLTFLAALSSAKAADCIEISSPSLQLRDQLQLKAEGLARIWADTILEGDYFADDKIELDKIELIQEGQQLLGYRITYSAKAWDTGTCYFDGKDLSSLKKCQSGRIVESAILSLDLSIYDFDQFAEFID